MDEITRLIEAKGEVIEKFRQNIQVFQTQTWKDVVEILEQAAEGYNEKLINDDAAKVCCCREAIRLVRKIMAMPELIADALKKEEASVDELKRERVLQEAAEDAFERGLS